MRKWIVGTAIGIGLISVAALAGDKPSANASGEKVKTTSSIIAIRQIETAQAVANWGRTSGNAHALIIAARMLDQVPTTTGDLTDRDLLLTEAKALGGADHTIRSQIAALRAKESKGVISPLPLSGAVTLCPRVIPSRSHFDYQLKAAGLEPLRIAAIGDGRTDIDMELRDENGHLVCRDYADDSTPACAITPARTGKFAARIINRGDQATAVRLITN